MSDPRKSENRFMVFQQVQSFMLDPANGVIGRNAPSEKYTLLKSRKELSRWLEEKLGVRVTELMIKTVTDAHNIDPCPRRTNAGNDQVSNARRGKERWVVISEILFDLAQAAEEIQGFQNLSFRLREVCRGTHLLQMIQDVKVSGEFAKPVIEKVFRTRTAKGEAVAIPAPVSLEKQRHELNQSRLNS